MKKCLTGLIMTLAISQVYAHGNTNTLNNNNSGIQGVGLSNAGAQAESGINSNSNIGTSQNSNIGNSSSTNSNIGNSNATSSSSSQGGQASQNQGQTQTQSNKQTQSNTSTNQNASSVQSKISNTANQQTSSNSGGNQVSGSSQGNTVTTSVGGDTYNASSIPVSTAYAAPLTSGADTCMGSSSGGVQAPWFGLSIGSTWTDSNCMRLKNAKMMDGLGMRDVAVQMMCQDPDIAAAMKAVGRSCGSVEVSRVYSTVEPQEVVYQNKTDGPNLNDEYIRSRVAGAPPFNKD